MTHAGLLPQIAVAGHRQVEMKREAAAGWSASAPRLQEGRLELNGGNYSLAAGLACPSPSSRALPTLVSFRRTEFARSPVVPSAARTRRKGTPLIRRRSVAPLRRLRSRGHRLPDGDRAALSLPLPLLPLRRLCVVTTDAGSGIGSRGDTCRKKVHRLRACAVIPDRALR